MERRLHPGLFQGAQSDLVELTPEVSVSSLTQTKRVDSRIDSLEEKLRIKGMEIEKRVGHRLDKMMQKLEFTEKKYESAIQNLNGKYSQLSSKVVEKRVSETKIQALLERHNRVIHQFDQKLSLIHI